MKRDYSKNIVVAYSSIHARESCITMEDQLRIASDLKKIATLPLFGKYDGRIGMWDDGDGWGGNLPVRRVTVLCNSSESLRSKLATNFQVNLQEYPRGGLLGYHVEDWIQRVFGQTVDGQRQGLEKWYADAKKGLINVRTLGTKSFSLDDLDKM